METLKIVNTLTDKVTDVILQNKGTYVTVVFLSIKALQLAKKDETLAPLIYHGCKLEMPIENHHTLVNWANQFNLVVDGV